LLIFRTSKGDRDIVIDMGKYIDQRVRVRFQGGREGIIDVDKRYFGRISLYNFFFILVNGVLKGFDKLDNLVLDECVEFLRGNQLQSVFFKLSTNLFSFN
jgi:small nuclear ribonucleoprotein (snRNP)-like protein